MDPWILTATELTAAAVYLANGYIGTALASDGGVLLESEGSPCYLRGVYEPAPPDGIDRLALLPSWNRLRYGAPAEIGAYQRRLDLRRGVLTTRLTLREARGTVDVEQEVWASRADQHAALVRVTVRPSFSGEIAFLAGLEAPTGTDFENLKASCEGNALWFGARLPAYHIELAESLTFEGDEWTVHPDAPSPGGCSCTLTADIAAGESRSLVQHVALATSLEHGDPTAVVRRAAPAYDSARQAHIAAWEALWQTDIEVDGDPEIQQYVRAGLFYLWSSVAEGDRWSIAPMGLSSNWYNGHIFWDAELWMYPSLLVTQPEMARSCVSYREHTTEAARRRAAGNGYAGSQFPWEAAFTGDEMTPFWAHTRDFQLHITADVAIGAWWYFLNTGDTDWLRDHGYPLMRECATYWVSRVEHNAELDHFEVSDVVCADEYAEHVNNDAFTNAAVSVALRLTARAAQIVGAAALPAWGEIADRMYVPYDPTRGLHIEYDGFDGQLTKQADVELLAYPLEYSTDPAQVARDLDYYATVIDPDGPAMSFSVYAVLSAQLGRADDAYRYLRRSFMPNCRPPFWTFSETPLNNESMFCTGIGGSLQGILFGFTGLRLREGWFALGPILPPQWPALRLRNLWISGARVDIEIEPERCVVRRRSAHGSVAIRADRQEGRGWAVTQIEGTGDLTIEWVEHEGTTAIVTAAAGQRIRIVDGAGTLLDMVLTLPPARPS